MRVLKIIAAILIMATTAIAVSAADVRECLYTMGDMVESKVVGNRIYVRLTKQVPLNEYENYYYHAPCRYFACAKQRGNLTA